MAVLFEYENELVWNPSPKLANIFLTQIRAIEEYVEQESGLGKLKNDEVKIELSTLRSFVFVLSNLLSKSSSSTLKNLVSCAYSISAGMLISLDSKALLRLDDDQKSLAYQGYLMVYGKKFNSEQ